MSYLKASKILLDEDLEKEINKQMENKLNVNNAVTYFSSQLFELLILSKISSGFIERCFPIAGESKKLSELEFIFLLKILLNSELSVDTELQVINAANFWLKVNKQRTNFAKKLLSRIRRSLLSLPRLTKYC